MSTYEARLTALRVQLKKDQLDGFVVPICDEHMSEYVGDYAQRLGWLTGSGIGGWGGGRTGRADSDGMRTLMRCDA